MMRSAGVLVATLPDEGLAQRREERHARPLLPMLGDRRLGVGGNLPIRFESAEVVDANDVAERKQRAHALYPPVVALLLVHRPGVERVAPELPVAAEVIGRDAGDGARAARGVEVEEFLVRPDVGAVRRHEDRHVADDVDAARIGVGLQRLPLAEEAPLAEAPEAALSASVAASRRAFARRWAIAAGHCCQTRPPSP